MRVITHCLINRLNLSGNYISCSSNDWQKISCVLSSLFLNQYELAFWWIVFSTDSLIFYSFWYMRTYVWEKDWSQLLLNMCSQFFKDSSFRWVLSFGTLSHYFIGTFSKWCFCLYLIGVSSHFFSVGVIYFAVKHIFACSPINFFFLSYFLLYLGAAFLSNSHVVLVLRLIVHF